MPTIEQKAEVYRFMSAKGHETLEQVRAEYLRIAAKEHARDDAGMAAMWERWANVAQAMIEHRDSLIASLKPATTLLRNAA